MAVLHLEHIGIVVEDLAAATEFFLQLGLELEGETSVEGDLVDRITGLEGARSDVVMFGTPNGDTKLELAKFHSPPHRSSDADAPANAPGIRHVLFAVTDIHTIVDGLRERGVELVGELVNYEDIYWLCYVRGPEGIIVELAEKID